MKHTHKFKPYKEIEIPNGKYLVKKGSTIPVDFIEKGFIDNNVRVLTQPCLILYCELCGDVNIEKLAPTGQKE